MEIIDEKEFKESMKNLIGEINQNHTEIKNNVSKAIDKFKLEFNDVEKLLVNRCLTTLNEKLKEFKNQEVSYESLQCWGKSVSFRVDDWDEYKAYRKFFERQFFGVDKEAFRDALRSSFTKYGLSHGGIIVSDDKFEYEMYNMYPGIQYKINS